MKVTPNYILPQLEGADFFDREALNDGFKKIDTAISDLQETFNNSASDGALMINEIVKARSGEEDLDKRLEKIDNLTKSNVSQLETIETKTLPELDKKRYKITRPYKKTFGDATVININNTGKEAEVVGFRSAPELANYPDRDGVIIYADNELPKGIIYDVLSFTTSSVTVVGDLSVVEDGMIIDCMNANEIEPFNQVNKYSGFVTGVSGQTINVSGWYKQGNTSEGQVPNKNKVIINPITKGWVFNANMFLNKDSFAWGGNLAEFGLWNRKSKATGNKNYRLNGIDMLMFDGYADYMYNASSLYDTTEIDKGYKAIKCNSGFYSRISKNIGFENSGSIVGHKSIGATETGFKSENEPTGFKGVGDDSCFVADTSVGKVAFKTINDSFRVSGSGVIKNLMLGMKIYDTPTVLKPLDAYFHFVKATGTYELPSPTGLGFSNIKIVAMNDVTITGAIMTNTGNVSSLSLTAWRTYEFFCDGAQWYRIF